MNIYVEILKGAHRRIESLDNEHVCVAISYTAAYDMDYPYDNAGPAGQLRDWIRDVLGPHESVGKWLNHEHRIPYSDLTVENLRQYRLDWINAMIEEVKELVKKMKTSDLIGPALIAAMRCFVASKLGDEIEIPEELT